MDKISIYKYNNELIKNNEILIKWLRKLNPISLKSSKFFKSLVKGLMELSGKRSISTIKMLLQLKKFLMLFKMLLMLKGPSEKLYF